MTNFQKFYQYRVQGVFSTPIQPREVVVVAGNVREYEYWRRMSAPLGICTRYIARHQDVIGLRDFEVIFVGSWRTKLDISNILAEIRYRAVRTMFWNDGLSFMDGCVVFELGKCFFPQMLF